MPSVSAGRQTRRRGYRQGLDDGNRSLGVDEWREVVEEEDLNL